VTSADHDAIIRLEERVTAHENLVAEQLEARDRAVMEVKEEFNRLAERVNRGINRSEHDALVERVNALGTALSAATGSQTGRYALIAIAAVVISLVGLIILVITHIGGA